MGRSALAHQARRVIRAELALHADLLPGGFAPTDPLTPALVQRAHDGWVYRFADGTALGVDDFEARVAQRYSGLAAEDAALALARAKRRLRQLAAERSP